VGNFTAGAKTICPFYIKEAKKSVTCEGLRPRMDTMIRFTSEADKRRFQHLNCERYGYEYRCLYAAALLSKYDEEGNEDYDVSRMMTRLKKHYTHTR
jgi:hypothetical protein